MCKGCPCGHEGPRGPEGPKWKNYATFLVWDSLKTNSNLLEAARQYSKEFGFEDVNEFAEYLDKIYTENRPPNLGIYSMLLSLILREVSYKQIAEMVISSNLLEVSK